MNSVLQTCNYSEVPEGKDEIDKHRSKLSWRNLLRQLLVSSIMWTLYFMHGLQMGAPTVLIPQLRNEANSTIEIDDNLASWITSIASIGAIPWSFFLPIIMHRIGRKKTYIFISFNTLIGILLIYLSNTVTLLLIGGFIYGTLFGSIATTSPFIITEYTSTKYRGFFLTIKSASLFWGMWVANIIGTYWHWKNIYILALVSNIYTMLIFFWYESPTWLAKEKRFLDCTLSHRKLKGTSKEAEMELEHLINTFKSKPEREKKPSLNKIFFTREFYKPVLLVILLGIQYHAMGKIICSMYAVQLLEKLTGNKTAAYNGMLILDGVSVLSAYFGCLLTKFCKRRTLLFSTSTISIIVLLSLSIFTYLVRTSVVLENNFMLITLLSIFSISVCCGPMILVSSVYGEITLIKYQVSTAVIYGVFVAITMMTSLKMSLLLFRTLTLSGTFLFFATASSFCTLLLYYYLPETKNKSIHEIEKYFIKQSKKQATLLQTMS